MPLVMLKSDARARLKPCLRCGYSLRNNIDARNCPECGLAVRISLRGDDTLEWSNPEWLRRIAWGVAVLAIAHVGFLVTIGFIHWNFFARGDRDLLTVRIRFFDWIRIGHLIVGFSMLLLAGGALFLAGREGRYPDRLRGRRIWLLVLAPLTLALFAYSLFDQITVLNIPSLSRWFLAAASVGLALTVWWYLHEIARRIPNRRCMRLIRTLAIVLTIGFFWAMLSSGAVALIYMQLWPWEPRSLPLTIGVLLYVPAAIGVMVYCWVQIRAVARIAEQNWVTDPH